MTFQIRPSAMLFGAAIIPGGATLQASTANTQNFRLGFAFSVHHGKKVMPAGEYQIERIAVSPFVRLTNLQTGESVNVMSPDNGHQNGNTPSR